MKKRLCEVLSSKQGGVARNVVLVILLLLFLFALATQIQTARNKFEQQAQFDRSFKNQQYEYAHPDKAAYNAKYSSSNDYRSSSSNSSTNYKDYLNKTKRVYSDRYNTNSYNNAEDFYDDNYDDFEGYDDAETYYNDHR